MAQILLKLHKNIHSIRQAWEYLHKEWVIAQGI